MTETPGDSPREAALLAEIARLRAEAAEVRPGADPSADAAGDTQMRQSAADWRSLFEKLQEGFFVAEMVRDAGGIVRDWRFIEMNEAWERGSGLSRSAARGRTIREVVPGIEQIWIDRFAAVAETGEPDSFHQAVDALARRYDVRAFPTGPDRVAVLFFEVSARDKLEAQRNALLEMSDRFRELDDPDAIAHVTAEILARTLGVSRAGYGEVDLARETITMARGWHAASLDSLPRIMKFRDYGSYIEDLKRGETVVVSDAFADPRTVATAEALAGISATAFVNMPVSERGGFVALLYLTQGKPRTWTPDEIAFLHDAAERTRQAVERRRAEQGLQALAASLERQVEERTRERDQLWSLSEDLLVVADYDGRLLRVSPSWTKQLGWSAEHFRDNDYLELVHPDERAEATRVVRRMRDTGAPAQFEIRMLHRDGGWRRIAWQLSAEPGGLRMTGTGRDVTAERARQAELDVAQEALRQSQKMEAVGQLTGGVAHDFNNLLTVIRSSIDLLKRPNLSEDRRQRYIGAISDTTSRAAKLTGQLLAFARRQALKPEVFDVATSVEAIGDMVGTLTGSRIRIEIDAADEGCFVDADPSQFDTALVNMAVNARDAMDGEGTLTISVARSAKIPERRAQPAVSGDFVMVTVADTGAGIAPGDLDRIFEPFFTTKGVGQGTGLGLSQVFGFAKQSGGEVAVESEIGRGTTFVLYLPRVPDTAPADRDGDDEDLPTDGHGTAVLVVEDNAEVGSFATQTLKELGYRPMLAANGDEALALLARDAHRFDIVFSDVVMPGISGVELAQTIRRRYPKLPVVLTSGYSHILAQEGPRGFDLLHKPYSIEDLSRILQKAAGRRRRLVRDG